MRVLLVLPLITIMLTVFVSGCFADEMGHPLQKNLLLLSQAKYFDGAGDTVDYVGPLQEAYWTAAAEGESLRKDLDWMIVHSTASGRLFAACLLCRLNKNVKALKSLESDKTEVIYSSGCRRNDHDSVGRIAKHIVEMPGHYLLAENGSPLKP